MADTLVSAIGMGVLRHALTGVATSAIAAGWITGAHAAVVVGAILEIAPIVWSAVSSWNNAKAQAVVAAVKARPDITVTADKGKPVITIATNLGVGFGLPRS